MQNINRIMIAGTNSGCGKTTITCALLQALIDKGLKVASFKCGPDYIDTMFHSKIIGAHSRNLDAHLLEENTLKYLFAQNSKEYDISIVEGVMGFYDGVAFTKEASSNSISNMTKTPVILVVNCKGSALSVVPVIKGFMSFSRNNIRGVILNGISKAMYPTYKELITQHLRVEVIGYMPFVAKAELKSRHLGLVTASEVKKLKEKINILAKEATQSIDLDALIRISQNAPEFKYKEIILDKTFELNIGVAKDNAFCFYYEDSLNALEKLGAKLVYFSPIKGKKLPKNLHGLILGGGYPELYAKRLGENTTMIADITQAYESNLPIFAECGGFMYLCKTLAYKEKVYEMVGLIDTNAKMTTRLQNFGYVHLHSKTDNLLLKKDEIMPAHEFHYFTCDNDGEDLEAKKQSGKTWQTGYTKENLFAGFPHLHFYSNLNSAHAFLSACEKYKRSIT